MKRLVKVLMVSLVILFTGNIKAQENDSLWARKYQFGLYNQYDLRTSSKNAISTHRLLHDAFRKNVKPMMNEKMGNISYGIFSFAATYLTMVWSHEIGHSLRAKQIGGEFRIHNAKLPIPYTTMHLPTNVSYINEALSVIGGFEVNYLTVKKIQSEYIAQNGIYNEDLAFAFANRIMYPLYTGLIVPINPKEKDVWINTAGDPVHCVLPVFKNYSNDQVFMADSSVNPELVSFYGQSALFASLINLLDPHFYAEVGASFGNSNKIRRPKFLIGNHNTGWTYGTRFNVSPLGYELYMNNYIHVKGNQFSLYAKYGNPFKNNGLGVTWGNMVQTDKLNISVAMDVWDQDFFGLGVSTEAEVNYNLLNKVDVNLTVGYKTEGYVLGKQIDNGLTFGCGIVFRGDYF